MNKWNEKDRAAVRTWAKGEGMLGVIGKAMQQFLEENPETEVPSSETLINRYVQNGTLIAAVIKQIKCDIADNDVTAIDALLWNCLDEKVFKDYLPDVEEPEVEVEEYDYHEEINSDK